MSASSAAVAVIVATADAPGVLLIRRAKRAGDRWSGHVALPGGRRDPEDKELLDTALRETREETGIMLPREKLRCSLPDVKPSSGRSPDILVRPFVFELPSRPPVVHCDEIVGHFWLPLDSLERREVAVAESAAPVPAFVRGEDVVWGMTYRILEELLALR